jgi:hypothetical protein
MAWPIDLQAVGKTKPERIEMSGWNGEVCQKSLCKFYNAHSF